MCDAIDAINEIAAYAEQCEDEELSYMLAFIKKAYESKGVHDNFSFGIVAKRENGKVWIWLPQ